MSHSVIDGIRVPPLNGKWGIRAKAAVVLGVQRGVITREWACRMYALSAEELAEWEANFAIGGSQGLLTTKAKFWAKRRQIAAGG